MLETITSYLLCVLAPLRGTSFLCCLLAALIFVGCSSGDGFERVGVSGNVTFQGKPVMKGQIRFVPKPGTEAPVVIEPIGDGRYATATSGGVPIGQFRVEIRAFDPDAPVQTGPESPPPKQLLPEKYNVKSQLQVTVESKDGKKKLDFDLE